MDNIETSADAFDANGQWLLLELVQGAEYFFKFIQVIHESPEDNSKLLKAVTRDLKRALRGFPEQQLNEE